MCGDATSKADVAALFAGEQPTLVVTSPPYAKQRDYDRPIACWDSMMMGALDGHDFADDVQLLINLGLVHLDGQWVPYWHAFLRSMQAQSWRVFSKYIWEKVCAVPGRNTGRLGITYEEVFHLNKKAVLANEWWPCKFAGQKKSRSSGRRKNGELDDRGFSSPVRSHRVPYGVITVTAVTWHEATGHPAQMPLGLAVFLIKTWQKPGCITYDPFCGAGTTLLAAERENVTSLGMEISPAYCAMAIARWNNQPGVTPAHLVGSKAPPLKLTSPKQLTLPPALESAHDQPKHLAFQ